MYVCMCTYSTILSCIRQQCAVWKVDQMLLSLGSFQFFLLGKCNLSVPRRWSLMHCRLRWKEGFTKLEWAPRMMVFAKKTSFYSFARDSLNGKSLSSTLKFQDHHRHAFFTHSFTNHLWRYLLWSGQLSRSWQLNTDYNLQPFALMNLYYSGRGSRRKQILDLQSTQALWRPGKQERWEKAGVGQEVGKAAFKIVF